MLHAARVIVWRNWRVGGSTLVSPPSGTATTFCLQKGPRTELVPSMNGLARQCVFLAGLLRGTLGRLMKFY